MGCVFGQWEWRAVLAACFVFIGAMSGPVCASDSAASQTQVTMRQFGVGEAASVFAVKIKSHEPVTALYFEIVAKGYRRKHWRFGDRGFQIVEQDGFERIVRRDGEPFDEVAFIAKPHHIQLRKDYQPISNYGVDGALVYTGHFWPLAADREFALVHFDLEAAAGGRVLTRGAYGKSAGAETPGFAYVGPVAPISSAYGDMLVDPQTPQWIIERLQTLSPSAFDWMGDFYGYAPQDRPNVFVSAIPGGDKGQFSFSGDAVRGQYQITLKGGAWAEASDEGARIFTYSTLHEIAHLWQWGGGVVGVADMDGWIHEGAAEYVASRAMVDLGMWQGDDLARYRRRQVDDCSEGLSFGRLSKAHQRGDYGALYACGFVLYDALAASGVIDHGGFWKALTGRVLQDDRRYAEAIDFFSAVGFFNPKLEAAMRDFVQTPHARPEKEIAKLYEVAGAPLAPIAAD